MAYSQRFLRATFLFTINGTDEIAATDISVAATSPATALPAITSGQAEDLSDVFELLLINTNSQRAAYSQYVGLKTAVIKPDGHYESDPTLYTRNAPVVGTATVVNPTSTVVLTLRSGQALGKGNYGRMYLPHMGIPNSSQPRMEATIAGAIADAGAEFVEGVNEWADNIVAGAGVAIMSQALPTPGVKFVTEVACGRVIDTQRRRRNALAEEYEIRAVS